MGRVSGRASDLETEERRGRDIENIGQSSEISEQLPICVSRTGHILYVSGLLPKSNVYRDLSLKLHVIDRGSVAHNMLDEVARTSP